MRPKPVISGIMPCSSSGWHSKRPAKSRPGGGVVEHKIHPDRVGLTDLQSVNKRLVIGPGLGPGGSGQWSSLLALAMSFEHDCSRGRAPRLGTVPSGIPSIHHADWPSVRLDPGETYRHVMVHRFSR